MLFSYWFASLSTPSLQPALELLQLPLLGAVLALLQIPPNARLAWLATELKLTLVALPAPPELLLQLEELLLAALAMLVSTPWRLQLLACLAQSEVTLLLLARLRHVLLAPPVKQLLELEKLSRPTVSL